MQSAEERPPVRYLLLCAGLVSFFLVSVSSGATWLVKPDGSGDLKTIQAAVDIAVPGDTLLLSKGNFTGPGNWDIRVIGKALTFLSTHGRDSTTIDGAYSHRCMTIRDVPSGTTAIAGITMRNGVVGTRIDSLSLGDGMVISNATVTIKDSRIVECGGQYTWSGGGIAMGGSDVEITATEFSDNTAWYDGGGHISIGGGTLRITNCLLAWGNLHYITSGGGAISIGASAVVHISGSAFYYNSVNGDGCCGGAIASSGVLVIRDSHFEQNHAYRGSVFYGRVDSLLDCTFANNGNSYAARGTVLLGSVDYAEGNTFIQDDPEICPDLAPMFSGSVGSFRNNLVLSMCEDFQFIDGSVDELTGNTFVMMAGGYINNVRFTLSGTTLARQNIFYDDGAGTVLFEGTGAVLVECSDIYLTSGTLGPAFSDAGNNLYEDPAFCDYSLTSDFTLNSASPCAPANSPCGQLIGARQAACSDCPQDTTLSRGARSLYLFPIFNPHGTSEAYVYSIQAGDGLQLIPDDDPGTPASAIGGARTLPPNSSATVAVWVLVDPMATVGDTLQVSITQARVADLQESSTCTSRIVTGGAVVGANVSAPVAHLGQNWPNPFNPHTTISFTLPTGAGATSLKIYDVAGRVVRSFETHAYTPGPHTLSWDGRSDSGKLVASGVYLYRLEGSGFSLTRKMVLVR